MDKRVLFLFKDPSEIDEAIKFSKLLKKEFKDLNLHAIYIQDITKYDLFSTNIEGVGVQGAVNLLINEYKALENKTFNDIKKELEGQFLNVESKKGETLEIILEEMKAYDLVVLVKSDPISNTLKNLLKYHYKPLIILSKTNPDYEYNMDKILMLNDGGFKANKSIYSFFSTFKGKNVDTLRVNVEESDRLYERFGKAINVMDVSGNKNEIILSKIKEYNFIIMGDLNYSVFVEKLAGNTGIRVIENSKVPIYIG